MQPLLSIVIPTKDRYKYLKNLIPYLDVLSSDFVEIVVQDNTFDNSEILEFLKSNSFNNLNYFYTREPLSIIENCDNAVLNSNGKYVCFLGDDDFICEKLIDVVKLMEIYSIDSFSCHSARYNWPDLQKADLSLPSLLLYTENDPPFYFICPEKRLNELLTSQQYSLNNLPKLYHGVVSKRILTDIYSKCNSFFPGFSPDISNAVAVCMFSKKHLHIELPLIIAGFGFNSTAGLGARNRHVKRVDQVSMLPKDVSDKWDRSIPYIWTGNTVWAASIIESLVRLDQHELLKYFSLLNFYSKFIRANPSLIKYALKSSPTKTFAAIFWGIPKLIVIKLLNNLPFLKFNLGQSMYVIQSKPISLDVAGELIKKHNNSRLNIPKLIDFLKNYGASS